MSVKALFTVLLVSLVSLWIPGSAWAQDFEDEFFHGDMDKVITKLTALDTIKTEPIIYEYLAYKARRDYLMDKDRKEVLTNIKRLVAAGADINAKGPKGDDALSLCIRGPLADTRKLIADLIALGADIRINLKRTLDFDGSLFEALYQLKEYRGLDAAVRANAKLSKKSRLVLDKELSWIPAVQGDDVAAVRKALGAKQTTEEAVTVFAVSSKAQKVFALICAANQGGYLTAGAEELVAILSDPELRTSYLDASLQNLRKPRSSFETPVLESVIETLYLQGLYPVVFLATGQANLFLLAADPSDWGPYLSQFHDGSLLFDTIGRGRRLFLSGIDSIYYDGESEAMMAKFHQDVTASGYTAKENAPSSQADAGLLAYCLTKKVGSVDALIGLFKANHTRFNSLMDPFIAAVGQLPGTTQDQIDELRQVLSSQTEQDY